MFDLQEVLATTKMGCDTCKGAIGRILKRFCYIIAEMFSLTAQNSVSAQTVLSGYSKKKKKKILLSHLRKQLAHSSSSETPNHEMTQS